MNAALFKRFIDCYNSMYIKVTVRYFFHKIIMDSVPAFFKLNKNMWKQKQFIAVYQSCA